MMASFIIVITRIIDHINKMFCLDFAKLHMEEKRWQKSTMVTVNMILKKIEFKSHAMKKIDL